ncbi:holo-[acyl-carrier protein] synthase [Microdochium nivale]|nr:holo-[acyl-carrier protein] synthase [Microdochium nivale]
MQKAAEYMAGRFAAKEAAIKAHPQQNLTFHQIEIQRLKMPHGTPQVVGELGASAKNDPESSGPPVAKISPGNGRTPMLASISISHDGDYAMAVCLGSAES